MDAETLNMNFEEGESVCVRWCMCSVIEHRLFYKKIKTETKQNIVSTANNVNQLMFHLALGKTIIMMMRKNANKHKKYKM